MSPRTSIGSRSLQVSAVALIALATLAANAAEVTVQNDSLVNGGSGNIQAGFVAGESAAAWLTSPCNGNIVAVQVFWRSLSGTAPISLEDSITIFSAGSFPVPGGVLALLEGPVMTDSVLNEFRYLDENNTIPISVPVTQGQVFVVSFKFANNPNPAAGPSVVTDIGGCQAGKNGINEQTLGWVSACFLGVTGDFFIRAVIDCPDQQGACCISGACQIKTQTQCTAMGGSYRGNGTTCGANTCDGACCFTDGTCSQLNQTACTSGGGTFKGVAVACTVDLCKGACCLPDGSCVNTQTPNECAAAGGAYKGDGTICTGALCTGACCQDTGVCLQRTLAQCNSILATWNGPSTNCTSFTCPIRGACCMPDGSCVDSQLQSDCTVVGGLYKGDNTNCTINPCSGACCFSNSCLNLTMPECQQIGGSVWQGPFTPCGPGNSCPLGACCLPLGDCVESTTPVSCAALSGVFHNGQTCAQAACPIPMGACCFNNGASCINNLQPLQCALISGSTWKGANSLCAVTCCPPPMGDMNTDTFSNGTDIQRFCSAMLGTPTNLEICKGDFNHNNSLDPGDIPGMVNALLTAP